MSVLEPSLCLVSRSASPPAEVPPPPRHPRPHPTTAPTASAGTPWPPGCTPLAGRRRRRRRPTPHPPTRRVPRPGSPHGRRRSSGTALHTSPGPGLPARGLPPSGCPFAPASSHAPLCVANISMAQNKGLAVAAGLGSGHGPCFSPPSCSCTSCIIVAGLHAASTSAPKPSSDAAHGTLLATRVPSGRSRHPISKLVPCAASSTPRASRCVTSQSHTAHRAEWAGLACFRFFLAPKHRGGISSTSSTSNSDEKAALCQRIVVAIVALPYPSAAVPTC